MILRNLLGLKPLGERQPTSLWIHKLLGKPNSVTRATTITWAELRLRKTLTPSQRTLFLEFEFALTVLHCVPGAGKTLLL